MVTHLKEKIKDHLVSVASTFGQHLGNNLVNGILLRRQIRAESPFQLLSNRLLRQLFEIRLFSETDFSNLCFQLLIIHPVDRGLER